MTRHPLNQLNYANDSPLEFRPPRAIPPMAHDRSVALSLCRQNPRTDPMTRQTSRPGSGSHGPSTNANNGGTPRRRIQVACGRCRKRKIRCSGDPGDNSGCGNCKAASVNQGTCVFLRVQCEMAELVPDHMLMVSGYEQVSSAAIDLPPHPYSSSSSASSSSSSLALGHPHPNIPSTLHHHHGLSSQHLMGQLSMRHHPMNPTNDVMSLKSVHHQDTIGGTGGTDGSGLILGGSMGLSSHRGSYEGDMSHGTSGGSGMSGGDLYNGNYPQFLQPEIATASSLMSGQQGQWSPLTSSSRQADSGLYLGQDQGQNLQSYIPAPGARIPSHTSLDGYNTIFPALNSLSSSLPEGVSPRTTLADRVTLPSFRTQASENISLRSNSTNDLTSGNYVTQSIQPPTVGRGYSPWTGDPGFTTTSTSSNNLTIPATKTSVLNISPPLSYLSPTVSQPTHSSIPPALPLPSPAVNSYTANTSPIFPLSSSNSSLLPSGPHSSSILNSSFDSYPSQSLQPLSQQPKSVRSDSESSSSGANTSGTSGSSGTGTSTGGSSSGSACTAGVTGTCPSGSKMNTPAPTMRTSSTSSSAYSPTYSRSSIGGHHDFVTKLLAAHVAD